MIGELFLATVVPIFLSFTFITEVAMRLTKYARRHTATNFDTALVMSAGFGVQIDTGLKYCTAGGALQ